MVLSTGSRKRACLCVDHESRAAVLGHPDDAASDHRTGFTVTEIAFADEDSWSASPRARLARVVSRSGVLLLQPTDLRSRAFGHGRFPSMHASGQPSCLRPGMAFDIGTANSELAKIAVIQRMEFAGRALVFPAKPGQPHEVTSAPADAGDQPADRFAQSPDEKNDEVVHARSKLECLPRDVRRRLFHFLKKRSIA